MFWKETVSSEVDFDLQLLLHYIVNCYEINIVLKVFRESIYWCSFGTLNMHIIVLLAKPYTVQHFKIKIRLTLMGRGSRGLYDPKYYILLFQCLGRKSHWSNFFGSLARYCMGVITQYISTEQHNKLTLYIVIDWFFFRTTQESCLWFH